MYYVVDSMEDLVRQLGPLDSLDGLISSGGWDDDVPWLQRAVYRIAPDTYATFTPLAISRDRRSVLLELPRDVVADVARLSVREAYSTAKHDDQQEWVQFRNVCAQVGDRRLFALAGEATHLTGKPTGKEFLDWIRDLERFYAELGLLAGGLGVGDEGLQVLAECFDDLHSEQAHRFYRARALAKRFAATNCIARAELEALVESERSFVLRWDVSEAIDEEFVECLSRVARGVVLPAQSFDPSKEPSTDYESFVVGVNQSIASSGRAFAMWGNPWMLGYFACVTPAELRALHARGVTLRVPNHG